MDNLSLVVLPSCEQKVVVWPSNMTEMSVYRRYKAVCLQEQIEPMMKSAFYQAWQDLHPSIGTQKPSMDLCFERQQFMNSGHALCILLIQVEMRSLPYYANLRPI